VDVTFSNTIGLSFGVTGTAVATTPVIALTVDGSPISSGGGYSFSVMSYPDSVPVTITNTSLWTSVLVSSISTTNDASGPVFSVSGTLPTSVAAGTTSSPFNLDFDLAAWSPPYTGALLVVSNGTPTPYTIELDVV
jgi:hypothetical protein